MELVVGRGSRPEIAQTRQSGSQLTQRRGTENGSRAHYVQGRSQDRLGPA